jgi:hypothetical protein
MGLVPASAPSWLALPLVMLVAGLWAALFPVIAHLSVAPDRGVDVGIGQLYLANVVGAVAGACSPASSSWIILPHASSPLR